MDRVFGLSLHYYCGGNGKDDSLKFDSDDWYLFLKQSDFMDSLLAQHWDAMGEYDRQRKAQADCR